MALALISSLENLNLPVIRHHCNNSDSLCQDGIYTQFEADNISHYTKIFIITPFKADNKVDYGKIFFFTLDFSR